PFKKPHPPERAGWFFCQIYYTKKPPRPFGGVGFLEGLRSKQLRDKPDKGVFRLFIFIHLCLIYFEHLLSLSRQAKFPITRWCGHFTIIVNSFNINFTAPLQ